MKDKHYVYMILTDKNTLYCGYTNNPEKRFKEHQSGKGAKYTRAFKPIKIVYQKEFDSKSEALKEEYRIKHKLSHSQKLELLGSFNK